MGGKLSFVSPFKRNVLSKWNGAFGFTWTSLHLIVILLNIFPAQNNIPTLTVLHNIWDNSELQMKCDGLDLHGNPTRNSI